jgi:hypothetical protein
MVCEGGWGWVRVDGGVGGARKEEGGVVGGGGGVRKVGPRRACQGEWLHSRCTGKQYVKILWLGWSLGGMVEGGGGDDGWCVPAHLRQVHHTGEC